MRYIIADIHGCYDEYSELLKKIDFSDEDELFVLGDAMDRGAEPIKVIRDLMNRPNVFYIMGNHDYMMLSIMEKLMVEITSESVSEISSDMLMGYYDWILNGGEVTVEKFRKLNRDEMADILDFLRDAMPYELIEDNGKLYILVHAGIHNFELDKELDEYDISDFIWERAEYEKRYFPNERVFLVTGHTPTTLIHRDKRPVIYKQNGHIAVDCGCVFGGNLAAYCIETGETTYVASKMECRKRVDG